MVEGPDCFLPRSIVNRVFQSLGGEGGRRRPVSKLKRNESAALTVQTTFLETGRDGTGRDETRECGERASRDALEMSASNASAIFSLSLGHVNAEIINHTEKSFTLRG